MANMSTHYGVKIIITSAVLFLTLHRVSVENSQSYDVFGTENVDTDVNPIQTAQPDFKKFVTKPCHTDLFSIYDISAGI